MAVIKVFIEGGVLTHPSVTVQTLNNSQRLRESFYKLLTQFFDPNEFSLQVEIGGPRNQAINFFKTEISKTSDIYLIVDLDAPKSDKNLVLQGFNLDSSNHESHIFFMIQEMEAWILSQPEKIEECFKYLKRRNPSVKISEDAIIKDKDPEDITKPSDKLSTLLGRYFKYEKKGSWKNKKYNKLKDGADLLELLDFDRLRNTFSDVEELSESFKKKA